MTDICQKNDEICRSLMDKCFLFKDHTHIPAGFVKNSAGYLDYKISESSSIEILVYILK